MIPFLVITIKALCKAEVDQFAVPIFVYHNMLWLQVSIYNQIRVEVLKGTQHLGRIEMQVVFHSYFVGSDSAK